MTDVLVIIPTYNEIENIPRMLEKVMSLPDGFDVLVIDDGSPDGTADAVRDAMTRYPARIHLECRKGKLGLGTAYIHGFKWALDRHYQYIMEMDADFSHNPDDLTRLYHECKDRGADVAVGSRYLTGVNVVNWPIGLCALRHPDAAARLHGRLRMLSPRGARSHRSRQNPLQRICVPNRDEV